MKKLDSNGRWQTKFIIPEHKEALNRYELNSRRKKRPTFDVQRIEELEFVIQDSISEKTVVDVVVFEDFEDSTIRGVVSSVDVQLKRIKVQTDDGFQWIPLRDLIDVRRV